MRDPVIWHWPHPSLEYHHNELAIAFQFLEVICPKKTAPLSASGKMCTAAQEITVTCLLTQESTISAENAEYKKSNSQYLHHEY
jgi:hypothetical protein